MAKELNIEPKLLDIEGIMNGAVELKSITYEMMLADAIARKSKEGILFLREQQAAIDERKLNSGKVIEVNRSIGVYRANYLKKFTEYKTKNELASEQRTKIARDKQIKEYNDLADLALTLLED